MHAALRCSACGLEHDPARLQNLCTICGRPLLARYDLARLAPAFTQDRLSARADRSMWRFREVLPVDAADTPITLGEGGTPLLRCERRGPFEPFENLFVKDESSNPTGSFKARGLSAAITRAAALGVETVALPSAGNAAGAATAYAARAGIACVALMPADTPEPFVRACVLGGARVHLVDGLIHTCGRLVRDACDAYGWFELSTLKEPFRVEGKKTMAYELVLDLGGALPDVIVYPTGGGTGLIGMWKAFDEMEALGWIGAKRPRMVAAQASGCCPIVRAFEAGAAHAETFADARTVASGLRVPAAVGDALMLDALARSEGAAIAVDDDTLLAGARELARLQGIDACPEGGAAWKAAARLLARGWIRPDERVVVFNTGTARTYDHLVRGAGERAVIRPDDPRALRSIGG